MDFPEADTDGVPRIWPEQVIRGDVCRYLKVCDDGTVHTSKNLTAHFKDAVDWWDLHLNPITDRVSVRVAAYLVRPHRQEAPTAPRVFAMDVAVIRYAGDCNGWLMVELEPGRYRAVGGSPVPGRAKYPVAEILPGTRPKS